MNCPCEYGICDECELMINEQEDDDGRILDNTTDIHSEN